jgi:hypothetical protein
VSDRTLELALTAFAEATLGASETDLEREWAWRAYDEGVRYAFFRTYEELRELAVNLADQRLQPGQPPTTAQRVVAQYQLAYRDLQAVLLGVDDELGARAPTPADWPLQRVVTHIIGAERQFFSRIVYAVERQRAGDGRPLEMTEEQMEAFTGSETSRNALIPRSLSEVFTAYDGLHARVLSDLKNLSDEDLRAPSVWWEEEEVSVRFRLQRFDSHLRQHTIHAEKTLDDLGQRSSEAKRLLRLIYSAAAEAEGAQLGVEQLGQDLVGTAAGIIVDRAGEIREILHAD